MTTQKIIDETNYQENLFEKYRNLSIMKDAFCVAHAFLDSDNISADELKPTQELTNNLLVFINYLREEIATIISEHEK